MLLLVSMQLITDQFIKKNMNTNTYWSTFQGK